MKRRICDILNSYKTMYPELDSSLPSLSEELEEEITTIFLKTGVVYHRPNRVTPSILQVRTYDKICFQRGISIDAISYVSGIGFFSVTNVSLIMEDVRSMFGLERKNLSSIWEETATTANWQTVDAIEQNTEYLIMEAPFTRGYWSNRPYKNNIISILRTGMRGLQLYYLYRYSGDILEVSPLPQWQVEAQQYRALANACLLANGTLPPIEYTEDGALVHLRLNYLLPPRELEFLKLYSWPEVCITLPSDFKRKLSVEVFEAIKGIFVYEGYDLRKR
ncbi:hypothetical protein SDC9_82456 [bioreactor metagenome]|uniref:Uncharacterized protein n=1 Tax=bioreactor metagenome TaxID=1076179 RepID=A0A644Z4Y7_9ZZZZ